MKRIKSEEMLDFAMRYPIFYIPPTLLSLGLLGFTFTAAGQSLQLTFWIKACLFIIGGLLTLLSVVLSAGMLYLIAKSLLEKENKND